MSLFLLLLVMVIVFASSFIGVRQFARHVFLADIPNERSSHHQVTSRAGGIAIFMAWGFGVFITLLLGKIPTQMGGDLWALLALTLFAGGCGVADDMFDIKPSLKFLSQSVIAVLFVLQFGGIESGPLPIFGEVSIGVLSIPLTLFWIVGMMNAYNFMDGANGLAASCGALVLFVVGVTGFVSGMTLVYVPALLMAASLAGFIPTNLFHGRIFMGDGGSQAVSFLLGAMGVLLHSQFADIDSFSISTALFLPVCMMPFIADVAYTLFHRVRRKQNILQAHREHVYQLLMGLGFSHIHVCILYLGMTAISCAFALAMIQMSPLIQWFVPFLLMSSFFIFAHMVFGKAIKAGVLVSPST